MGIVFLLHFGLFHGLALLWQCLGVAAKPVMRSPLLASSLAAFWSKRWNTAFNTLACDLAYRPLARRLGSALATLAVFLISGLIHDLVISLPARSGYGWPTAYFLLQGGAVLLERSRAGRALGLGRGLRGWLFVLCVTAVPAVGLFHPSFIRNVILPMFQAIGATWNTP
jgi:D-alanyl-lipoteichoic acid acyltransferase DltB (MBOAT superfamily)